MTPLRLPGDQFVADAEDVAGRRALPRLRRVARDDRPRARRRRWVDGAVARLRLTRMQILVDVVWKRMSARVGLLWRAEWDPSEAGVGRCRLHAMFAAFAGLGVAAEPVVYSDDGRRGPRAVARARRRARLGEPVERASTAPLDALLREVADRGVWVSAHPDVILRMATKQVLVDTAGMSWSADTHLYRSLDQLRAELPGRLAPGPLVLKQHRGMGGDGRLEGRAEAGGTSASSMRRGAPPRSLSGWPIRRRCEPYFAAAARWSSSRSSPARRRG